MKYSSKTETEIRINEIQMPPPKKVDKKVGASKPNKFKTWKLKQPFWKQFLIELPIYLLLLWLLNLLFNLFGYEVTPW